METILVIIHTEPGGVLARSAREALGAALTLRQGIGQARMVIGLVGEDAQTAGDSIAGCAADGYFEVSGPAFAHPRYATDAAAASAVCREAKPTLIIAPGTSRWNRVIPGVAQRLGGSVDTHITGVSVAEGNPVVNRWFYRQRMEATQTREQRPWFMLVDPGSIAPCECDAAKANLQKVTVDVPENYKRTVTVGIHEPKPDAQTIRPDARLLFVAGAGWTKKQSDGQVHTPEAEKLILDFLKASRASLGSSKSLLDLGGEGQQVLSFLSHLNQIGQTGATPRHQKGLSTCCHGEEPHTVGWRFINERRAISLDPNCGWARGKADVLYVADAFKVIAETSKLLATG